MSRKSLCSMLVAGAGLAFLAAKGSSFKATPGARGAAPNRNESRQKTDEATRRYLMYIIMPIWSLTGFLDWLWHRQTKIETTSGVKPHPEEFLSLLGLGPEEAEFKLRFRKPPVPLKDFVAVGHFSIPVPHHNFPSVLSQFVPLERIILVSRRASRSRFLLRIQRWCGRWRTSPSPPHSR